MFLGLDCSSDDDCHYEVFERIRRAVFLDLRFQNWARIVVRSRLFCKAKTIIFRDATPGAFELRRPLFLLRISEFRKAVGMLRLRCTEKLKRNCAARANRFWMLCVQAEPRLRSSKSQHPSTKEASIFKLQTNCPRAA